MCCHPTNELQQEEASDIRAQLRACVYGAIIAKDKPAGAPSLAATADARLALALISDRVAVPVADASLVLCLEGVDAFDRGQRQVRWYLEALEVLPRGDFVVEDDGRADP